MADAPKIDTRSRDQIFAMLADSFQARFGVDIRERDQFSVALLQVFSRYCELIIERLNRVPGKNLDAFLNILRTSPIPPSAALAPLSFTPVKNLPKTGNTISVPARTKVAAPPGEGESEPAVFETTRILTLTNTTLKRVYSIDPRHNLYSDKSSLASITPQPHTGEFLFSCADSVPSELYLAHAAIFGADMISELRLKFTLAHPDESYPSARKVQWFIPAPDGEIVLSPREDSTSGLTRSGEIVFVNLPEWPTCEVFDRQCRWLGCRFSPRSQPRDAGPPPDLPGCIAKLLQATISSSWSQDEVPVESACFNTLPLDLSKDFFPLGEAPRFGDVFYLKDSAFSRPDTQVSLGIEMTNPASSEDTSPLPPVDKSGNPVIHWEWWNGRQWNPLDCQDGTESFTTDGKVTFTLPGDMTPARVNGTVAPWIRARLVAGNYGGDGLTSSQFTPPSIRALHITSSFTRGPVAPEQILTNSHFSFDSIFDGVAVTRSHREAEHHRALYLGMLAPETATGTLPDEYIDLYFHICGYDGKIFIQTDSTEPAAELAWQYWNGEAWLDLRVDDGTDSLTVSGLVHIRMPKDIALWRQSSFGGNEEEYKHEKSKLHWLRVIWSKGDYDCRPKVSRILLNTVPAIHTDTIENEILGSSNRLPNQVFRSARRPLLRDLELEIVEPAIPSEVELKSIRQGDGKTPLTIHHDRHGNIEEILVRWTEVDDFLSSATGDRHFVVDRQKGEVHFGDGINGLIPPRGTNNVRLAKYTIGGGASGNKPAGCITQLRSSILYVDSVVNLEAAEGGLDAEDWPSVRKRGASVLRHRGRAVTVEDYEDLAMLASPTVARTKCIANRNLSLESGSKDLQAGIVSLIVVPHGRQQRPTPKAGLLRRVRAFLDARRMPDAELIVLEPDYVEISLKVVVTGSVDKPEIHLVDSCREELERFLHPLTGGGDGRGWCFGQLPAESDVYALLESIEGLESVRSLHIEVAAKHPEVLQSPHYLISSGQHEITLEW